MQSFHGIAVLRNDGLDVQTGKIDLNAGVSVPVKVEFSSGGDATLFDLDDNPIANPTSTDDKGNYAFKVADGVYDIIENPGPNQTKLEKVSIADPMTTDITGLTRSQPTLAAASNESNPKKAYDGLVIYIEERTTGNGGGALWKYVDASTVTPNTFNIVQCIGVPALALVLVVQNNTVDASSWGVTYNPSDSSDAIKSLLESNVYNIVFSDECSMSSVITTVLTSNKKLIGDGLIKWVGVATSGIIITVDCDGFDFEYDIKTDGDNLISAGWLIENSSPMSGDLPTCLFKGNTKGFKATAATVFNSNAYIRGSFDKVEIYDGNHSDTSRSAGLGVATQTIVVDKKGELYPYTVKHFNNIYSGIASDDVGAADMDTDYFVCTMPDPTNFPNGDGTNGYPDINIESYGNTYHNPIGRCEKFQCVPNTHDNVVVRDGDGGSRTMNGSSVDFNMQWGVGECRNQTVYLKGSSTSPITTGYTPVSYFQGTDYGERRGATSCSDIVVYNQINSALNDNIDNMVGLQTNATSAAKPFSLVDIKNISAIGGTIDHVVIMSYEAGGKGSINIDNVDADFNFNPVAIQTSCPDIRLVTKNITNLNATERVMINDVGGAARAFNGQCFGFNHVGIEQTYEFGATSGATPELAGAALVDQKASQNSGGAMSVQSKFMADEETYIFDVRGFTRGNHLIFVNISFGAATAQAILACQGASAAIIEKSTPTASLITTGTGSNPDTDGLMNLWVDANGALNAKNRLGSSRAITVSFLG